MIGEMTFGRMKLLNWNQVLIVLSWAKIANRDFSNCRFLIYALMFKLK